MLTHALIQKTLSKQISNETNSNLKIAMIAPPFYGHFKVLAKLALEYKNINKDFSIKFIVTGWTNMSLAEDEIRRLQSAGIDVQIINDDENIKSSSPMEFTFDRVNKLSDKVIEACRGQDYIINDFFSIEGYIAGKILNIPSICSIPAVMGPFNPMNPMFLELKEKNKALIKSLENKYQLNLFDKIEMVSDGFLIPSEFENIVWSWPKLIKTEKLKSQQFEFNQNRKQGNHYNFVRPEMSLTTSNHQDLKRAKAQGKKIIYVSLGTVVCNNLWKHEEDVKETVNQIYAAIVAKYANSPDYEVIISTGRATNDLIPLQNAASNFHVYPHLDQLSVLQYADVFVTHAGGNSVNEAIDYETPMVAIPFFGDQHQCADNIEKLGIGLALSHQEEDKERAINTRAKCFKRTNLTDEKLISSIETVLNNQSYKDKIHHIKKFTANSTERLAKALINKKVLNWQEGDLLYGSSIDRKKFAALSLNENFFRIGDERSFSMLFNDVKNSECLPKIVDQYNDVLTNTEFFSNELHSADFPQFKQDLLEFKKFLEANPDYLKPIGNLIDTTPDKGQSHLETLWNMCLGGLEFFTKHKKRTVHFIISSFNDLYSDAPIREIEWIKSHWHDDKIREKIKFYHMNNGIIREIDPVAMHWFKKERKLSQFSDLAPVDIRLNAHQWHNFQREIRQKAPIVNPRLFHNIHPERLEKEQASYDKYQPEIINIDNEPQKAKVSLQSGELHIFAMLPNKQIVICKRGDAESYISHAMLSNKQDVVCSGELRMRNIGIKHHTRQVLDISNKSGHFLPNSSSLLNVTRYFEDKGYCVHRVNAVRRSIPESINKVEDEKGDFRSISTSRFLG